MTRERGDWIPWYCEDSPGWVELSFAARGVAEGIARKMGPKRNALYLGHRGLRGLCRLLHGRWEEFEPAMRELLSPGPDGEPPRLQYDETTGLLSDPEHEERRRPTSADWMREKRARDRAKSSPPPPPASDAGDGSDASDAKAPPCEGGDSPSPLLSSDLISSSREGEREREVAPPTSAEPAPVWFEQLCETITAGTGEQIRPFEAWLRYAGHREAKAAREGRPFPPSPGDARYWVTTVLVAELRKQRRWANRDAERDRSRGSPAPSPVPKETPEQAREFTRKIIEAGKAAAAKRGAA